MKLDGDAFDDSNWRLCALIILEDGDVACTEY